MFDKGLNRKEVSAEEGVGDILLARRHSIRLPTGRQDDGSLCWRPGGL